MNQLGIDFADIESVTRRVWALTGGHPNLVQRLCYQLVSQLEQKGQREINVDTVDTIASDPNYQGKILNVFWEQTRPIERLITLIMIQTSDCNNVSMLQRKLRDFGISRDDA